MGNIAHNFDSKNIIKLDANSKFKFESCCKQMGKKGKRFRYFRGYTDVTSDTFLRIEQKHTELEEHSSERPIETPH